MHQKEKIRKRKNQTRYRVDIQCEFCKFWSWTTTPELLEMDHKINHSKEE